MAGYEILLLDEGSEILGKLARTLKQAGYKVTVGKTAGPVINSRHLDHFDLMVARLPSGNLDRLQELQNFKKFNPLAQAILLSGDSEMVFPLPAYQMGIDDYIFLPCSFGELWRRISACLVRVKLQRLRELSGASSALINQRVLRRLLSKSGDLRQSLLAGMMNRRPAAGSAIL